MKRDIIFVSSTVEAENLITDEKIYVGFDEQPLVVRVCIPLTHTHFTLKPTAVRDLRWKWDETAKRQTGRLHATGIEETSHGFEFKVRTAELPEWRGYLRGLLSDPKNYTAIISK